MARICKVDTKTVSQLQATRTEATFSPRALGITKKVYALSRYIPEDGTTKNAVTTTTVKPVSTVAKVASVDSTKLKAVIVGLHQMVSSSQQELKV